MLVAYFLRLSKEWHSIPAGMEWSFHSCRNGVVIPFLQEWSGHSIPAGMKCSFHSCRNGMTPFHSSRNGVVIPFLKDWNDHSIPLRLKWLIFILVRTKCIIYYRNFCQNPNLTTTQPKPNLNLVGFDTIITLHHPTHPTGTLSLPQGMDLDVWNLLCSITHQY